MESSPPPVSDNSATPVLHVVWPVFLERVNSSEFDGRKEVAVSWNGWIRQIHRWVSIVFTVTVIANFVALAQGGGMPPPWVTYSPLLPLALLLFSGLYLFALPYVFRRRAGRTS
jgi:hypothetical protein